MSIRNVMIDLETYDTVPGGIILTVGACTFDLRESFYERISFQDSIQHGFTESRDTARWWDKQDVAVKEEAMGGTSGCLDLVVKLADWMAGLEHKSNIRVWGNGADFDLPILRAYYDRLGVPLPWGPFSGRCYRTLKDLLPHITPDVKNKTKHNALEDAIYQARHAVLLLNAL